MTPAGCPEGRAGVAPIGEADETHHSSAAFRRSRPSCEGCVSYVTGLALAGLMIESATGNAFGSLSCVGPHFSLSNGTKRTGK